MLRRDFCFAPGTTSTLSCSSHCEGLNFVTTALLFSFFFFALAACNYARHWADSSDSHHWAKDGATWSDWASLGKHSLWQTPTVMYKNGYTWLNVTLNRTPVKPAKIKPTATKMSVQIQKNCSNQEWQNATLEDIHLSGRMRSWVKKNNKQRFYSEWENLGGGWLVCVCVCVCLIWDASKEREGLAVLECNF